MVKKKKTEEFYIGQIFEDKYPSMAAVWCKRNNAQIQEIDPVTKEVEETYIEIVQQEQEVVVPAVTHEEIIPAEYDEDGNIIKEEETVVVVDEPEHTEIITIDVPEERTHTVEKTLHRYEIQAIPEPTEEEIKRARIAELKAELDSTDYVVIKIAEADTIEEQNMLREHYSDIITNRKSWRDEINELEG